jgi:hypothetical protein
VGASREVWGWEERRQDTISDRGGNFHAGEVAARVGFNGPNKARLKCGPLGFCCFGTAKSCKSPHADTRRAPAPEAARGRDAADYRALAG